MKENFDEKFVEVGIGDITKKWQLTHAYNICTSRISPALIDGLKPVVRRALYIMFLKDGGKTYRKVATISGEVFGRVHPHCLHGDTKFVLISNGHHRVATIKELYEDQEKYKNAAYVCNAYQYKNDVFPSAPGAIFDFQITKRTKDYCKITFAYPGGKYAGELKCTDDHEIFIRRKDSFKNLKSYSWIQAKDIQIGDFPLNAFYANDNVGMSFDINAIYVSNIETIHEDEEVNMYDFSGEDYENAYVLINETNDDFLLSEMILVHNSPVAIEDAIVGVAQTWRNIIPLIEGKGNFGACVSKDTEVAVAGWYDKYKQEQTSIVKWVSFEDYDQEHPRPFASVDPETGEWKWQGYSQFFEYDFNEMYPDQAMIAGVYAGANTDNGGFVPCRGIDEDLNGPGGYNSAPLPARNSKPNYLCNFLVTPDHNMLINQVYPRPDNFEDINKFELREAKSLPEIFKFKVKDVHQEPGVGSIIKMEDVDPKWNYTPKVKIEPPVRVIGSFAGQANVPLEWWFKMIATFLVAGYVCEDNTIHWLAEPLSKVPWVAELVELFGLADGENPIAQEFINYGEPLGSPPPEDEEEKKQFEEEMEYESFIPSPIFSCGSDYLELFVSVYNQATGGGSSNVGSMSVKTKTKLLVDQFQIIAMMCSCYSMIGISDQECINPTGKAFSENYNYIMCGMKDMEIPMRKNRVISTQEYSGKVYCAQMDPWHTLVTRRKDAPLIIGNCSGDRAGASRYIYARLSEYALACFFEDWKDSVVDTELAYDEETKMPLYLPAKYPNILLNGCLGIGYGLAALYPAFNFREVIEATILLMHNPKANIILIPDSPTGADIIETDFARIANTGKGSYMQRCTYDIDAESNMITITSLPDLVTANDIRTKIADIKEKNGLPELITMNDLSGKSIQIQLIIRNDVNPYKFMKKLINQVAGLEKTYPVSIVVSNDYQVQEYSLKQVLLEWIQWRREQKRVSLSNKRGTLLAEQRVNDIKLFIMNSKNLQETLSIFKNSHDRTEIEEKLIAKYHDTEIRMDSVQARALSNMRMIELSINAYEGYKKRKDELIEELKAVETPLTEENGVDKVIIAELRDGIKRFGAPRRSNVVPYQISVANTVEGTCILQLTSDGMITRIPATNAEEEPIPTDTNGYACLVDNDSSFIIVDDKGYHTFIKVNELPTDTEVPVFRYSKKALDGNIVALLPVDLDSDRCVTLVSKKGILKKIKIADIGPSKKPLIAMEKDDRIVRGIVLKSKSQKDLLIYTRNGMGQRLDPNSIRITSPQAKGLSGFKLKQDDEICGIYAISPESNAYLLYVTTKGKMRLNLIDYLPTRESKHDEMVQLISLNDRDKLVAVVGCNKYDKVTVYYDDADSEVVDIQKMSESTMSSEPKKMTNKNAVSSNIVKVKIN